MAEYPSDPYAEQIEVPSDNEQSSSLRTIWFSAAIFVVAALFVGVIAYTIYNNEKGTLKPGEDARDFALTIYDSAKIGYIDPNIVMDMSGETVRLSDFKGDKVVVINFWQDQCPPCHDEADMLVETYKDYRDQGVIFLGINVKDPDDVAYGFLTTYNVIYPNGLDRGDHIADDYGTTGQPETFIIDRDGVITYHRAGPLQETEFRAEIDRALENS